MTRDDSTRAAAGRFLQCEGGEMLVVQRAIQSGRLVRRGAPIKAMLSMQIAAAVWYRKLTDRRPWGAKSRAIASVASDWCRSEKLVEKTLVKWPTMRGYAEETLEFLRNTEAARAEWDRLSDEIAREDPLYPKDFRLADLFIPHPLNWQPFKAWNQRRIK